MGYTEKDRNSMRENLLAAGCSETEIGAIMTAMECGDKKGLGALVDAHRKDLLEQFHSCKQCIDCMDYFTYKYQNS